MIKKTQRLLFITARVTGVDVLVGVLVNKLDGASLETLLDGTTREGAVDLRNNESQVSGFQCNR